MLVLPITVNRRVAEYTGDILYVCCNTDYTVRFTFDAEWDTYPLKTARFVHGGSFTDVVFDGDECKVPMMMDVAFFRVGVYAGDLRTTTAATVRATPSVMHYGGTEKPEPTPEQYDVIMERVNQLPEALSAAKESKLSAEQASKSAEKSAESASQAAVSEEASEASATSAEESAKRAAESVAAGKYIYLYIDENGKLYAVKTDDFDDFAFLLDENTGKLYLEV